MKKKKGSTVNALVAMIVIIAVVVLMMDFLYIVQIINYKEDIRQIARGYILEMETVGYLTPSGRTMLLQELSDKGLRNIDLDGTTQTEVGYGSDIVLSVQGDVPTKELDTSSNDMFSFFFDDKSFVIKVKLQSTAKQ